MGHLIKRTGVVLLILVVIAAGAAWYLHQANGEPVAYRSAQVKRGDLVVTIAATGTVEPEEVVDVGAQVAGQIVSFGTDKNGKTIDYGSTVEKGTVLARIDDSLYAADALVATTSSQIPSLEAFARQAIYSLSILLGREPAALLEELSPEAAIPVGPPAAPVGVPADLLRRRPDIRRAEARIHAATAQIGVATADLFPKFALSGSAGFQSNQFSSWLDWVNRFWSFGPSADWQIFASGGILANIEVQKAFQEQTVIAYQQTVLTALQDVENALIASAKETRRHAALLQAVSANRRAVQYATELYTQGQVDFLNVLDAQRSLYVSEEALAQSVHDISIDLVALYKALGGGWEQEQPAQNPAGKSPDNLTELSFQDHTETSTIH
jgi:multidrug efflux pump subunit AcrA (membrane-fusion protein)